MNGESLDVLCFGEALLDFFPERPGVPLDEVEVFHRHLGGAPANVAVGLGRLGVRVGLMTLVGRDDFGRFVRRRLERERVDTAGIGVHPSARTGVTFVAVGARGERSFLFFRHPSADQQISVDDVDVAQVTRARVLHVGSSTLSREPGRAATWKAIEAARAAGRLVSTDPNFRPHLWEDPAAATAMMRRLVSLSDVVKVSEDEIGPIVGTEDVTRAATELRALGPQLVVVTLGERGCYWQTAAGQGSAPGNAVPVVDTTGAGDAFVAGLLSRLLRGEGAGLALDEVAVAEACALGNRLGAAAVTAMGATAGLSYWEAAGPGARGGPSTRNT